MSKLITRSAIILTILVLFGCAKESGSSINNVSHAGEQIRFGASINRTAYTKLQYSGEDVYVGEGDSKVKVERIDWTPDYDVIRIYSAGSADDDHQADYKIVSATNSGRYSVAEVSAYDDSPLTWGSDPGTQKFTAVYPSPAIADESTDMLGGHTILFEPGEETSTVTIFVPYVQEQEQVTVGSSKYLNEKRMKYCYMVGAGVGTPGDPSVEINFAPVVTTFDIVLVNNSGKDLGITALSLIDVEDLVSSSSGSTTEAKYVSGTADATFGVNDDGSLNVKSKEVTNGLKSLKAIFNDDASAITVANKDSLKATLIGLPREYTAMALKVEMTNGEKYLFLKDSSTGSYITFEPQKKYNITVEMPKIDGIEIPGVTIMMLAAYLNQQAGEAKYEAQYVNGLWYLKDPNNSTSDKTVYYSSDDVIKMCADIKDLSWDGTKYPVAGSGSFTYYSNMFISSYALSFFKNAENMNLTGLSSTLTVDVTGLNNLKSLTYNTNMNYVNVSHCQNLQTLNIYCKSTAKIIGLSHLPSLVNLYINGGTGTLQSIDAQECKSLKHIYFDSCEQIRLIDLDNYDALEWVWATNMAQLSNFEVYNCDNLATVVVEGNNGDNGLKTIAMENCPKLSQAYVLGNPIYTYSNYSGTNGDVSFTVENTNLTSVYFNSITYTSFANGWATEWGTWRAIQKGEDGVWKMGDVSTAPTSPTQPTVPFPSYPTDSEDENYETDLAAWNASLE